VQPLVVHDTPYSHPIDLPGKYEPVGLGALCTVHADPLKCSTSGARAELASTGAETAVHDVADAHDTLPRISWELTEGSDGVDWIDQLVPL
jgi:hypothetical protein